MRKSIASNKLTSFFVLLLLNNILNGQIIEEGKGIGNLTLGIKESKVIEILGNNFQRTSYKDYYELEFRDKSLNVGFDADSIVNYILIKPEIDLVTKKGLKIGKGLTLKNVKRVYNTGRYCSYTRNKETMSFCYDYGISFTVSTIYKNDQELWFWKNFFQMEKEYKNAKVLYASIEESELKKSDYTFYEYYDGIYIPRNIDECINEIDKLWNDSIKEEVLKMSESEFTASAHFGMGLWIRNNWRLWSGSRLLKYFNELGIHHPDDMSNIILVSYYRKLHNQDIGFKEQIDYYRKP